MILAPEHCGCPIGDQGPSILNSPICSGTILFMALVESFLKSQCDISTPCQRIKPVEEVCETYDFIVVGAGSAGSIVAGRLSEEKDFKVLLLEAGGTEPMGVRIPSFYRTFWTNPKVDWDYWTEPGNYCLETKRQGCQWPRGKSLGGTSLLNGMAYHRGHAADYEDWTKAGATGWSWEENMPYFYKTEGNKEIGTLVKAKYHSSSGPLPVKRFNYQPPFLYEILNGVKEAGLPVIQDMNDPDTPEGFTVVQTYNFDGQRFKTARAFLKQRPNLDVALNAHVSKVLTETCGEETRAVGVEYYDSLGKLRTVHASKEVIISGGTLNTPQILMLSGIGPKETLEKFNIPVVKDLPVGQNLRCHYGLTFNYVITKIENIQTLDWSAVTEYLLTREGPMSSTGLTQLSGILYSSYGDRERKQPDLQFFFNGFLAECSKTGAIGEKFSDCSASNTNITAKAILNLPRSIGYVTLNSTNPFDQPLFYPNFFSHPEDMVILRDAARYLQRIFGSDVMKNKYGVELDSSTNACALWETWSDDWIDCIARVFTDPQDHQVGTAAMGHVTDPYLRVYNIPNLRVIDASSMPTTPTGNPQAPTMMVAERGADFIKKAWL